MSKIAQSIYNIRKIDDLSQKTTFIHRLHPLVKFLTTVAYMALLISFDRYETVALVPFALFPLFLFVFGEIPFGFVLKRVLLVEPFIIGVGILNPLFDPNSFVLGGLTLSVGWLTFLAIFIKSTLLVTATILLIATTGMDNLAKALRMLKIPKVFVLQLLLTYRFITVLAEEVFRMIRAYTLRAPGQKGIHISAWGSFAGQLILRSFERAQRIYQSMVLRGFQGEYNTGVIEKIKFHDIIYFTVTCLIFMALRFFVVLF